MANLFQPSLTRATDSNGNPISGAKLWFYLYDTSTPAPWYLDAAGGTAGTNPHEADSVGLFDPAYLDPDVVYRIRLTDADGGTTVWDLPFVRGYDETQLYEASDLAVAAAAAAEEAEEGAVAAKDTALEAAADSVAARDDATDARDEAEDFATIAAAVVDSAPNVYADTTAGLAAVASGEYFYVEDGDDNLQLYLDNAGVAVAQGFVLAGYASMVAEADRIEDAADEVTEALSGIATASRSMLAVTTLPDDGIIPELVDIDYRMLRGRDADTGEPVGFDIDQITAAGGESALAAPIPLDAADVPERAQWTGIVVAGESLAAGAYSTPVLSSSQPYSNKTFGSGPKSSEPGNSWGGLNTSPGTATVIPLVEDLNDTTALNLEGETICSGMANGLVEYGARFGITPAENIFFASCAAKSGYRLDQIHKGSAWWDQLVSHVTEQMARATAAGKTYTLPFVPLITGLNDNNAGTAYATYLARLLQLAIDVDTDMRAITGQATPVYLLVSQQKGGGDVARATFDAVNQSSLIKFVTHTFFYPTHTDHAHLSNVGTRWMAAPFARSGAQMLYEEREPDSLWPIGAWAIGTTVYCKFRVPRKPLVLDTTNLGSATDYGILVTDDTGDLTLSGAAIVNDDTLSFTINRELEANPVWRCGLDYLGSGYTDWASGNWYSHNLRDSTTDAITISAVSRPLFHVAPSFEIPISVVES